MCGVHLAGDVLSVDGSCCRCFNLQTLVALFPGSTWAGGEPWAPRPVGCPHSLHHQTACQLGLEFLCSVLLVCGARDTLAVGEGWTQAFMAVSAGMGGGL